MFFLAVYIHMFRGLYYGSYKEPREVLWILGVILYLLMMATGFMGYVLVWGQMSFWAATVITNLFSAIPGVGDTIVTWLWGGYRGRQSDAEPLLLAALPVAVRDRRRGGAARLGAARGGPEQSGRHRAEVGQGHGAVHALCDGQGRFRASCASACLFAWFVFYIPNFLGHRRQLHPGQSGGDAGDIVPEWYYLPFYAILRAIPNKLLGVCALFGSIVILAFLPWLDTSKVRSARYRPLYRQFFWLFVIAARRLGWLGTKPPEGIYVILARIFTFYYFAFFLIVLPLLGIFEKTKPLPNSISESVLGAKA